MKRKSKKNWIAGAIEHPGALTKKAESAGQSPQAYAQEHKQGKGTTGKQARLAIILAKMRGKRKARSH